MLFRSDFVVEGMVGKELAEGELVEETDLFGKTRRWRSEERRVERV